MKGFLVIEILIVIFIIILISASLLGMVAFSLRISNLLRETAQAQNLAQEVIEAIRNFRDGTNWGVNGLGTVTNGISYFPKETNDNPPKWQLIDGEEEISGFNRKVVFSAVQRDTNDNIVESGGVEDLNTKKIKVTISWKNRKVEIITYLTDWR